MITMTIAFLLALVIIAVFELWIRWYDRRGTIGMLVAKDTKVKTPPAVLRARAAKRGWRGKDG